MINPRRITNNQSSNFKLTLCLIIDYCLLIIAKMASLIIGYFKQTLCLIIGAWLLIIILNVPKVNAESLSVSLRVGDTRIQFSGYTSPGAFITVKQNNVVISTLVSDSSGAFDQTIDAANPGLQSFTLHATDSLGLTTPTLSYNVNLTANTLTSITNIVFPPTIVINTTTYVISGMSHPLSELTLILSDSSTYPLTVTAAGNWSFDLTTLPGGSYTAYVIATMPGNIISLESEAISFSLASVSTSSSNPSSQPASSNTPTNSFAPSASIKVTKISTPNPSPSESLNNRVTESPTPLTTFAITIAKPISVIYFGAPLILIMILTRLTFFKKHKKKRK